MDQIQMNEDWELLLTDKLRQRLHRLAVVLERVASLVQLDAAYAPLLPDRFELHQMLGFLRIRPKELKNPVRTLLNE